MARLRAPQHQERRLYTGSTNDLTRRLHEHQLGKTRYTRHAGPFELILTETYPTRLEARHRERYLKTGCGREELNRLLQSARESAEVASLDSADESAGRWFHPGAISSDG